MRATTPQTACTSSLRRHRRLHRGSSSGRRSRRPRSRNPRALDERAPDTPAVASVWRVQARGPRACWQLRGRGVGAAAARGDSDDEEEERAASHGRWCSTRSASSSSASATSAVSEQKPSDSQRLPARQARATTMAAASPATSRGWQARVAAARALLLVAGAQCYVPTGRWNRPRPRPARSSGRHLRHKSRRRCNSQRTARRRSRSDTIRTPRRYTEEGTGWFGRRSRGRRSRPSWLGSPPSCCKRRPLKHPPCSCRRPPTRSPPRIRPRWSRKEDRRAKPSVMVRDLTSSDSTASRALPAASNSTVTRAQARVHPDRPGLNRVGELLTHTDRRVLRPFSRRLRDSSTLRRFARYGPRMHPREPRLACLDVAVRTWAIGVATAAHKKR